MTKKTFKVVSVIFVLLLGIYFAYQIYMIAYPDYKTEVAVNTTVSDNIKANGIVVRDETVIENSDDGIINFLYADGEKVAKDAAVAEIYSSSQAAANSLWLSILTGELDVLKTASNQGRTSGSNVVSISNQINETLASYANSVSKEDYSTIASSKNHLLRLLDSFMLSSGKTLDFSSRIAEIESQISALNASDTSVRSTLYAPTNGYFISTVDGYETLINKQMLEELSAAELEDLIQQAENAVVVDESHCKVVSDYSWVYAAVMDSKNASKFEIGKKYNIDFKYALVKNVPVNVTNIIEGEAGKNSIVVFECTYLNSSITSLRAEEATVNFTEYTGIRVPRSALRLNEDVVGVFIKYGSLVQFKQVDIIYETDSYILSKNDPTNELLLAQYDEMITEGKDIYEGRDLGNKS